MAPYITKMSATQQLTYYDQYVSNFKKKVIGNKPLNALQLYLMNAGKPHLVKRINSPLTPVLTPAEFAANKDLDLDKDGVVTIKDMQQRVDNIRNDPGYKAVVEALNKQYQMTLGIKCQLQGQPQL
jgi:hypothetical protein